MNPSFLTLGILSRGSVQSVTEDAGEALRHPDVLIGAGNLSIEDFGLFSKNRPLPSIPLLYVPGPSDFSGKTLRDTVVQLRAQSRKTTLKILYRNRFNLAGIRFLGVTLWPGFDLFGEIHRKECEAVAAHLPEFQAILDNHQAPISMHAIRAERQKDVRWLQKEMALDPHVPKVLITHFAPVTVGLPKALLGKPLAGAVVSPCEALVHKAGLVIHGKATSPIRRKVGQSTQIVALPSLLGEGTENVFSMGIIEVRIPPIDRVDGRADSIVGPNSRNRVE